MFLIGPLLTLFLTGCAAVLMLAALLGGRSDALARLGMRAAGRLEAARTIPLLWGLAAGLLIFLLAAALFKTHMLALLGALVLVSGFGLAGLGLLAAALSTGTRLSDAFALPDGDTVGTLRLGLWTLGLATAVPVAGWLLALLALASGMGAVLETLVMRPPSENSD